MAEPIPPPSRQPKRFFDIVPPKDTVPSATSRPLIPDNQPLQSDPMVVVAPPDVNDKPEPLEPVVDTTAPPLPAASDIVEPAVVEDQPTFTETIASAPKSAPLALEPDPETTGDDYEHELPSGLPLANDGGPADLLPPHTIGYIATPVPGQITVSHHQTARHAVRRIFLIIGIIIFILVIAEALLTSGLIKSLPFLPRIHRLSQL